MCPYIQSTSEEKDKAQPDTDHAVSLGHKAEFSTPESRASIRKERNRNWSATPG
jgi:hypothetical protein